LETAATVGEVVFFPGANTLFEGQQINGHRQIKRRDKDRRDIDKRTQIKRDQRRRSRKIKAADPKMIQDRSETQRQRVREHCKQRL
jgi:hypothetical protein